MTGHTLWITEFHLRADRCTLNYICDGGTVVKVADPEKERYWRQRAYDAERGRVNAKG